MRLFLILMITAMTALGFAMLVTQADQIWQDNVTGRMEVRKVTLGIRYHTEVNVESEKVSKFLINEIGLVPGQFHYVCCNKFMFGFVVSFTLPRCDNREMGTAVLQYINQYPNSKSEIIDLCKRYIASGKDSEALQYALYKKFE